MKMNSMYFIVSSLFVIPLPCCECTVGADTTIEIPMNSWTLLAFSFQNISTNSNNNGNYIISVYVDGVLDVALTFTGGAIANDGPLQLFKDVSHNGTSESCP